MMDDLINRQDAIDAIEKYLDKFDCIDANFLDGLKTTKKILNDLPSAESEQQWIPCHEKLPEKGKVVLITNDKGNVRCGQYRGLWRANGNVTQWTFRGNVIETVVAWMPLPDAYEEDD